MVMVIVVVVVVGKRLLMLAMIPLEAALSILSLSGP
jgi:hypothetical protein